jgi:hypothetical protein
LRFFISRFFSGGERENAHHRRIELVVGEKKTGRVRGVLAKLKNCRSCFYFAFILLSTVQIARDIGRHKEDTFTLKRHKRTKN